MQIPPFDHPLIIEGHKSLIHEISDQLDEAGIRTPDALICSVGGGGLLAGLLKGILSILPSWSDGQSELSFSVVLVERCVFAWMELMRSTVSILACETAGAASLSQTLRSTYSTSPPRIVISQLENIDTIAASLGSKSVSGDCMKLILDHSSGVDSDDGVGGEKGGRGSGRVVSVVMEDQRTVSAMRDYASKFHVHVPFVLGKFSSTLF